MKYNSLGKSGITVSEIGLGCEGFLDKSREETAALFEAAIEGGINVMDMYSPDPDMQQRVGEAIYGCRDKFVLQSHICTKWQNGQYSATRNIDEIKVSFEASLRNLNTDYVDIGMIHYVDNLSLWYRIVDGDIMKYAKELKAQGKIRCIGISSHNPAVALEAVKSNLIEVLMFSVNPCYDLLPASEDVETLWSEESYEKELFNIDPERELLYQTCQRQGVGITVMKAFGGGDLLTRESPSKIALTPLQCIHYALSRPGVASIMSGIRSIEELKQCLYYETATPEEKDYATAFASFPKISWKGHCMYCGHCAPCPKNIDIAAVTKFLNLAKAQGVLPETVREHYNALTASAADCVACGLCEKRCPFSVQIVKNMQEAKKMFGN